MAFGSLPSLVVCLAGILWPNHPLGHDELGTAKQLRAIDANQLRLAHAMGYSRNRSALFVAGDIERTQLMDVVATCLEQMPDTPLTQRQRPATYGPLPKWNAGKVTTVEASYADTIVYLLFLIAPLADGIASHLQWDFLEDVFSAGDLGSPLNRLVREDERLAYSPEFISMTYPDGGYAGLVTQTSATRTSARCVLAINPKRGTAVQDVARLRSRYDSRQHRDA